MRIIETKVYTIDEHPNKENVYNWIRNNWHEENQHSVEEIVDSLKALQEKIGGRLDYCFGQNPDRGEYISLSGFQKKELKKLKAKELPLTGVCWDHEVIKGAKKGKFYNLLKTLHQDTEYHYSDEGLEQMCHANGYEFTEDGKFHS